MELYIVGCNEDMVEHGLFFCIIYAFLGESRWVGHRSFPFSCAFLGQDEMETEKPFQCNDGWYLHTRLVGGLEHGFYFSIYWESWSQLTNIFQRGWNHQAVEVKLQKNLNKTCRCREGETSLASWSTKLKTFHDIFMLNNPQKDRTY